jgi:hypothetical protein
MQNSLKSKFPKWSAWESGKINNFHFHRHRRFRGGELEAHPKEKSIIVNYKLEAAVYGEGDVVDPMLRDKKVSKLWIQQQTHIQGL